MTRKDPREALEALLEAIHRYGFALDVVGDPHLRARLECALEGCLKPRLPRRGLCPDHSLLLDRAVSRCGEAKN
jgi:hypothetical protein